MRSEWQTVRAADVIDFNPTLRLSKGTPSTKIAMEKLLPFTKRVGGTTTESYAGGSKFCNGDTIMARITPCLENGKTAFIDVLRDGEVGFGSTEFIVLRAKPGITDEQYVYYLAISPTFRQIAIKSMVGSSGRQRVQQSVLDDMVIELPPIEEQAEIGQCLAKLDDRIALNDRINDNLEQQIGTLLMAFIDEETATPVRLGDFLYIKGRIGWKGLKKNEYLPESGFRIVNGETLTKAGIDWSKAGYITEERYLESPEIMLQVGDILLSKDGTIGKIGYVDNLDLPTSVASGIFVIRNSQPNKITTPFIYYLLKSKLFEAFIAARTEGSVIPHLYQKDFMDFVFPLPIPNRMAEFEQLTSPMFSQVVNNLNENKALATTRDSLLPRLMSGEIDVTRVPL